MRKHWYFILMLSLLPIITYGQNSYYSTDSVTEYGVDLLEGNDISNSKYCQVETENKVQKYSPYQIKEYGFKDGRSFKSYDVKIDGINSRYFLTYLAKGNVDLYYLKIKGGKKHFYAKDSLSSNLIEIPTSKKEYRVLFDSVFKDCPLSHNHIPYIKLNKYNLARMGQDYNQCANRPFPRIKYGFAIGLNVTRLSSSQKEGLYSYPDHQLKSNFIFGFFMDLPIYSSNYSFHPEINYRGFGITEAIKNDEKYMHDIVVNYSSISLPLLLRYTFLSSKISPYFQAGPVYARAIKNIGSLYEYVTEKNNIYINTYKTPIMQKDMGGFSIGSGFISKYDSKCAWFTELSYSKYYNLRQENNFLNINDFNIKIGLIY